MPAFVLAGDGVPFHGIPVGVPDAAAEKLRTAANIPLRPETREMFMKAVDALRSAGAEVVIDDTILPASFAKTASRVATYAYMQDGTNRFLATFGPAEYHSAAEYQKIVGAPLFPSSIGTEDGFRKFGTVHIDQRSLDSDPEAERMYHAPRRAMLGAYLEPLDRLKLDGYVYPAIQMPPPDETMAQDGRLSEGPHSATSWVNMIGVPAVVVPRASTPAVCRSAWSFRRVRGRDGDLLAIAYAWEQATHLRKPPTLVEHGLLAVTPAREARSGPRPDATDRLLGRGHYLRLLTSARWWVRNQSYEILPGVDPVPGVVAHVRFDREAHLGMPELLQLVERRIEKLLLEVRIAPAREDPERELCLRDRLGQVGMAERCHGRNGCKAIRMLGRHVPGAESAGAQAGQIARVRSPLNSVSDVVEDGEELVVDQAPALGRAVETERHVRVGRDAVHLVLPGVVGTWRVGALGPRIADLGARAARDEALFPLVEHRKLRRDDHERNATPLAPSLEQRTVREHVVQIAFSVSALAIATERHEHRPSILLDEAFGQVHVVVSVLARGGAAVRDALQLGS